ncbi:hypothetical protein B0T21DRAFT_192185 [Apiosordaria backusii]|uniref:Uncharacterized protein n=1 Tax=Apiosordaria backusii TaxID=314023 RepID=A0AA40BKA5_9PEZI|nr:hypothetical protein B0T21DRAFT_192185 [Apiosordaria backusii]
MTPKRLQILQPLTSKQWPLSTVAYRHFASSSDIKTNHKPQPPKPSLYQLLFPKDPTPKPSKASHSTTSTSNTSNDDLEPPRISLQDDQELSEWMKQLHSHTSSKTDTGHKEADIPTVLILSAPRDLLESDFYRVAPQGQHVQGWTSGPDKVIQSRSQTTLTPQELYYLFFPSRPSATYYLSILKHQHSLARTTLLSLLSSPHPFPPLPSPFHTPSSPPLPKDNLRPPPPPHLPHLLLQPHPPQIPPANLQTLPFIPAFIPAPLFPLLPYPNNNTNTTNNNNPRKLPPAKFHPPPPPQRQNPHQAPRQFYFIRRANLPRGAPLGFAESRSAKEIQCRPAHPAEEHDELCKTAGELPTTAPTRGG